MDGRLMEMWSVERTSRHVKFASRHASHRLRKACHSCLGKGGLKLVADEETATADEPKSKMDFLLLAGPVSSMDKCELHCDTMCTPYP